MSFFERFAAIHTELCVEVFVADKKKKKNPAPDKDHTFL